MGPPPAGPVACALDAKVYFRYQSVAMKNLLRLVLSLSASLLLAGTSHAHYLQGYVYCDDGNGVLNWGDIPVGGAEVIATRDSNNDLFGGMSDASGYWNFGLPYNVSDLYHVALSGVGIPASATILEPVGGTFEVNIVTGDPNLDHRTGLVFLLDHCAPPPACTSDAACADGNPCTDDVCNPAVGCEHRNNSNPCNDGNVCTTNDVCYAGYCQGGAPLSCGDGNSCTADSCNPQTGCQHTPSCLFTRTPGFWKNHPKTTQATLDGVGGVDVCGRHIDTIAADDADSALEALCVAVRSASRVQLARQLMAAALNMAAGGQSFGNYALCNAACANPNAAASTISNCINTIDTYNNSGDAIAAPFDGMEKGDDDPCSLAKGTACLITAPLTCASH